MAEMAFALGAAHLGADHAVADVAMLGDHLFVRRRGEARPAAARIIFGVALEQDLAAASAAIGARVLVVPIFAGEGPFGARLTEDMILLRRELLAPFGIGEFELVHAPNVGPPPREVKRRHHAVGPFFRTGKRSPL